MASHSSILAWRISWTEGAWQGTIFRVSKSQTKLCPTLFNTVDGGLPGSSVRGMSQGRILEWVAMPSSKGSSRPRDQTLISYVSCFGSRFFTILTTWEASIISCMAPEIKHPLSCLLLCVCWCIPNKSLNS